MEPTGTNGRTRHTLSDPPWGLGLVLWWFSRWMARNAVSCGRNDDTGKAFRSRPLSGSRTATTGIGRVAGSVAGRSRLGVGRLEWFCGGHGPGETPGPFPNPEAKAWHGDGTALERVWESSAPPHSTVWTFWSSPLGGFPEGPFFLFSWGFPPGATPREPPFFVCCAGQPAGARCPRFPRRAFPVARRPDYSTHRETLERRGISGISGEPLALIRWLNRLKNYALFRTQTLCRIEQNHVSRQSNSPAGRRPKLA